MGFTLYVIKHIYDFVGEFDMFLVSIIYLKSVFHVINDSWICKIIYSWNKFLRYVYENSEVNLKQNMSDFSWYDALKSFLKSSLLTL